MKQVLYKNLWLQKGSVAFELYFSKEEGARKKLDKHLKEIETNYKELS
jgi:hypothetical protein